jgi:hypothetical protein
MGEISDAINSPDVRRSRNGNCKVAALISHLSEVDAQELTEWIDSDTPSAQLSRGIKSIYTKRADEKDPDAKMWLISVDTIQRHRRPRWHEDSCGCTSDVR